MSEAIYEDMKRTNRERVEMMVDIYESADCVRDRNIRTNTHQTLQNTGSSDVTNRSFAPVCLVLLCFLLLTAVIVLSVYFYTNYTQERNQLLTNITNLTEEKEQLLTNITNITEERNQLLTNITNLTEEKDQLLTNITNLTEERDQLLTNITNLTEERDQLLTKTTNLTEERCELLFRNNNLTKEKDQLLTQSMHFTSEKIQLLNKITNLKTEKCQLLTNITNLSEERYQQLCNITRLVQLYTELVQEKHEIIKCFTEMGGRKMFQSSCYFISSGEKNWTESRRYCRERGADLIIINNREEQRFVQKLSGDSGIWIGLTDSDEEDRWKWIDGSELNYKFWSPREPSGHRKENCALMHMSGWYDFPCSNRFKWICEKKILQ